MKVLHIYRTYFPDPPGGVQEVIRQISLGTGSLGVENQIFTLSPQNSPREIYRPEGIVTRGRSWAAPASCDLGWVAELNAFARLAAWADVLHYHFPWPFADVLHLMAGHGKAAVMTYHSDIVRQWLLKHIYGPVMQRMLGSMSAIVATSPVYASTSPLLCSPAHAGRVRVIPLGIAESSHSSGSDNQIFSRMGFRSDEPYILFNGVLRYYKGLHFLVDAAARVKAPVVISGSGPEEVALKSRVAGLGLRNVIFTGQVSDAEKMALFSHCRALVLPSHVRSEAFGMVLIEAGMRGKPMVSCEVGSGTSFANLNGETGLVVPPENPEALAVAMNQLLEDADLATRFGTAARQRYEQLFSGTAQGQAYASLYQEVWERRSVR